ncbi:U4/U6.U5 small nuclear ribonucleoprotein 27 kDa protein [Aphelenchoides fujianensis]|nr:U4/U6.U5 small nuclear ribonucleoprotein 27 kDa protein [Aphelenchoides fujianensis]
MADVDRKRRHERDDEADERRREKRHKHERDHRRDEERERGGRRDDERDRREDDRQRRADRRDGRSERSDRADRDRKRRHSRSRSASKERSSGKRSKKHEKAPLSLDEVVVNEDEMMKQMGFAGFDTTKNKKVEGNVDGVAKVNKARKYRQYMNRAVNIANDLKSCVGRLVTAEQDDDVYQGKVVNVIEDGPALVFSKPFLNGSKISNEKYALNLNPNAVVRINDDAADSPPAKEAPATPAQPPKPPYHASVVAAATPKSTGRRNKAAKEEEKKPELPAKNKKMDELLEALQKNVKAAKTPAATAKPPPTELPGPSIQVTYKQTDNEPPKLTILKRGHPQPKQQQPAAAIPSLIHDLAGCALSAESPPTSGKKFESKLEMIPPQVLNGKKAQRTVLDQLLAKQQQPTARAHSSSSPQSISPPIETAQVPNGTRIDLNALLSSANKPAAGGGKQKRETEHKSFGDFKQFTSKLEPKPQQRPPAVHPKGAAANAQKPKQPTQMRNGRAPPCALSGPSGIPEQDSSNGYRLHHGNDELNEPIDLTELDEDFDFSGNLALFRKDETESDWEEDEADEEAAAFRPPPAGVVYEEKVDSYRNDENILKDPQRVTSWVKNGGKKQHETEHVPPPVKQKAKKKGASPPTVAHHSAEQQLNATGVDELHSLRLQTTKTVGGDNASRLPVLKAHDKKLLIQAASQLYGEHIFNCIAADRFADFVFRVHKKLKLPTGEMLLVAGANCPSSMLHRFAQFFVNRAVALTIYDPPPVPGNLLRQTRNVRNAAELPKNPAAIYFLSSAPFHEDEELQRYVLRCSRPQPNGKKQYAHLIALDFRLYDVAFMHTLYLGAVDESVLGSGRQRHPSADPKCAFDARVADLGIPFQWVQCPNTSLAKAFGTSLSSAVKL